MTESQFATSLQDARSLIDALLSSSRNGSMPVPVSMKTRYRFGRIELDVHFRRVTRDGREIALSPREYELLVELARADGAPVSIDHLMRSVWKGRVSAASRTIAQHVAELRSKLEDIPAEPKYLLTVRKVGYRLTPSSDR